MCSAFVAVDFSAAWNLTNSVEEALLLSGETFYKNKKSMHYIAHMSNNNLNKANESCASYLNNGISHIEHCSFQVNLDCS